MKNIKIFTYADRYNFFLDIWLKHYTQFTQLSNITILYIDKSRFNLEKYLENKGLGEINVERVNQVDVWVFNLKQKELLKNADVVIYADIDEIIFHENLFEITNTFSTPHITTDGFEIIHDFRIEKDFDVNEKILKQRSFGIHSNKYYDKPLIIKEYVNWGTAGKHSGYTPKYKIDGLYLIHLNRFDFNTLLNLNNENKIIDNNPRYWHHLICDETELKKYYEKYFFKNLVEIPNIIKEKLDI